MNISESISLAILVLILVPEIAVAQEIDPVLSISNGADVIEITTGEEILVYGIEGRVVASGNLEGVKENSLVVVGRATEQIEFVDIAKLVIGIPRTFQQEMSRQLMRALYYDLAIGVTMAIVSVILDGSGSELGVLGVPLFGIPVLHGSQIIQIARYYFKQSSAKTYFIGQGEGQYEIIMDAVRISQ